VPGQPLSGLAALRRCALDTLYIDPEAATVDLVWRATLRAEAAISDTELRIAVDGEASTALTNLPALQAQAERRA
jgi:hypothetical protein